MIGDKMNGDCMDDSDKLTVFGRIHDALLPERNCTGPKNLLVLYCSCFTTACVCFMNVNCIWYVHMYVSHQCHQDLKVYVCMHVCM